MELMSDEYDYVKMALVLRGHIPNAPTYTISNYLNATQNTQVSRQIHTTYSPILVYGLIYIREDKTW